MKNRTVILTQKEVEFLLVLISDDELLDTELFRQLSETLDRALQPQDINYQAAVRYQALVEKIQESLQVDFDELVGVFPGEYVIEFGKIMSLGLRNLDFEIDLEAKHDIGCWTNECLVAGLSRLPGDWEEEYRRYEIEETS